jgi:hypothetical protein
MSRLNLDLMTARLASLQSGGTVEHIGKAASQAAAIERGRAASKSVWVYRQALDTESVGPGMRQQIETIGVLIIVRELANAPSAGATNAEALDTICSAVEQLLAPAAGWSPAAQYMPLEYAGGESVASTSQASAWEDRYLATTHIM